MDISLSKLIVTYSIFVNNQVFSNGGVITMIKSLFQVYRSLFVNNTAAYAGGVLHSTYSSFNIIDCYFRANYAQYSGGVVDAKTSTFIITKTFFFNNGGVFGGVMCLDSLLHHTFTIISDCIFLFNVADAGGIMEIIGSTVIIKNCKFNHNIGSLYAFNSNITLGDQNIFEECIEPHSTKTFYGTFTTKEGGAITIAINPTYTLRE